jgi:hypothetical protein
MMRGRASWRQAPNAQKVASDAPEAHRLLPKRAEGAGLIVERNYDEGMAQWSDD